MQQCDADTIQHLRAAARAFEILDRKKLFGSQAQFARGLIADQLATPSGIAITAATSATLVGLLIDSYVRRLGREDLATEVEEQFRATKPNFSKDRIEVLYRSLDSHEIVEANSTAVSAVVTALLTQLRFGGDSVDEPEILRAAAKAAHDNGLIRLQSRVLERYNAVESMSPGYLAIRTFYTAQWAKGTGDISTHNRLRSRYIAEFSRVKRSDLAAVHVEQLGRFVNAREQKNKSLTALAAQAAEAGDVANAARYYEQLVSIAECPDQAGFYRMVAETSKLKSQQLDTVPHLLAALHRLADDHITRAKPLLSPDVMLPELCNKAVELQAAHPNTEIALQTIDFAGDVRLGAALDHRFSSLRSATTALADLSTVDALQRDPDIIDTAAIKSALPGASIVWVISTHDDHLSYLTTVTLCSDLTSAQVRRTSIPASRNVILRRAIGRESEALSDNDVQWLTDLIFGDLCEPALGQGLYVVPDRSCWELPWLRLIPAYVPRFATVPSIAAAMRLAPHQQHAQRRRVIGLFNNSLDGANQEHQELKRLHETGLIEFYSASSFHEVRDALQSQRFDLLAVTAHGTRDEGFEFTFDFGAEKVALLSLLELPLPPVVSLGSCWSARSVQSSTAVVAVMGCLAAGASTAVGGLWDLDDTVTAKILVSAYRLYADGLTLPSAIRRSYANARDEIRSAAAGLCIVGRW